MVSAVLVSLKIFENIDCVETIDSVQKSSKSEPSSQFFGLLNFFCEFRFDRFDIPFDAIHIVSEGHAMVDRPANSTPEQFSRFAFFFLFIFRWFSFSFSFLFLPFFSRSFLL